jgi:hypothetical protein
MMEMLLRTKVRLIGIYDNKTWFGLEAFKQIYSFAGDVTAAPTIFIFLRVYDCLNDDVGKTDKTGNKS